MFYCQIFCSGSIPKSKREFVCIIFLKSQLFVLLEHSRHLVTDHFILLSPPLDWILEHRNLVTYLILSFWHGAQSWHRIQTHYILLLWRINKMHRHVRHLVNTCQIESLIDDLELFSFQGICSVSLITEFTIQQSLHYGGGKKTRKESWSFKTIWIEIATSFLSSA